MKKTGLVIATAVISAASLMTAYADTEVSGTPYVTISSSGITSSGSGTSSTSGTGVTQNYVVISSNPGGTSYGSSSGSSYSVYGPSVSGQSGVYSAASAEDEYNQVGADHINDAKVSLNLGFTVVSPAHSYGGFKVAEGSVQLSDGSWDTIGYDKYIRGGYYRLLREEVDSTGTAWYVVKVSASKIGDYSTPDGSVINELWLKKSDCTATDTIEINTSDAVRQNIVRTGLSLLGSTYSYGSTGPDAFDCSGFVNYVMSQNGISVPRTSTEICNTGTQVGITGLLPGDIVGRSGHVGIYIGDGYFVHSSETTTGVIVESVAVYNTLNPFTNYVSVVN